MPLLKSGIAANDRLVTFGEPDESGGEQAMTELWDEAEISLR